MFEEKHVSEIPNTAWRQPDISLMQINEPGCDMIANVPSFDLNFYKKFEFYIFFSLLQIIGKQSKQPREETTTSLKLVY